MAALLLASTTKNLNLTTAGASPGGPSPGSRDLMGSQTGSVSGLIETVALVAIAVGSFLFTVGLVGVFVDTVRLRPILLEPAPGLTDIFSED